jgi:hypothetical protein
MDFPVIGEVGYCRLSLVDWPAYQPGVPYMPTKVLGTVADLYINYLSALEFPLLSIYKMDSIIG